MKVRGSDWYSVASCIEVDLESRQADVGWCARERADHAARDSLNFGGAVREDAEVVVPATNQQLIKRRTLQSFPHGVPETDERQHAGRRSAGTRRHTC